MGWPFPIGRSAKWHENLQKHFTEAKPGSEPGRITSISEKELTEGSASSAKRSPEPKCTIRYSSGRKT